MSCGLLTHSVPLIPNLKLLVSVLACYSLPSSEFSSVFTYPDYTIGHGSSSVSGYFQWLPYSQGFVLPWSSNINPRPFPPKFTTCQSQPSCSRLSRSFTLCSSHPYFLVTSTFSPRASVSTLLPGLAMISLPFCLITHNNFTINVLFRTHLL